MEIIWGMILVSYVLGIFSMTIVFKLTENITTSRAFTANPCGSKCSTCRNMFMFVEILIITVIGFYLYLSSKYGFIGAAVWILDKMWELEEEVCQILRKKH